MFYLPLSLFNFIASSIFLFPSPQFYYFPSSMFLFPPPQFYYFPSSFLNSLPLHNISLSHLLLILFLSSSFTMFTFFPRQSLFPSSSTILFFPLPPPPPYLFYIFFHPQIHRPPIDPTSTPHRPYIDPTSTPHRPHIDPTKTLNVFIPSSSYSSTSSSFLLFSLLNVFIPSSFTTTTTSTTFLLFPSTTTTFVGYRNNRFCPDTNPYISNVTQQCRIVIFGA